FPAVLIDDDGGITNRKNLEATFFDELRNGSRLERYQMGWRIKADERVLDSVHPEGIGEPHPAAGPGGGGKQPCLGNVNDQKAVLHQQLAQLFQDLLGIANMLQDVENRNHVEVTAGGSCQKLFDGAGITWNPVSGSGELAVLPRGFHAIHGEAGVAHGDQEISTRASDVED